MSMHPHWTIRTAAALFSASFFASLSPIATSAPLPSEWTAARERGGLPTITSTPPGLVLARAQGDDPARTTKKSKQPPARPQLPPRIPFTAAEDAVAVVPGMPDARFWADAQTDFKNALPPEPGPWLVLSSGGEDGAFGAGMINGLTAGGKRPDYVVVTGVSTGSLMAPFAFAGPRYDDALRRAYTEITAADVFEAGGSAESFVDSWPLKDLIAKEVTPELLVDIAAQHRRGRRLFIITSDIDAMRSVVWNVGAIAAHGGDEALKLVRTVLLASSAVPGAFPPVLIDVEANGKHFQEMHADGGLGGQFFVAPAALMASSSDYRLPATQLDIIVNTDLQRYFKVVERFVPSILAQSVGMAVPVDTRLMIDRAYIVAKRSGSAFNVATIPASFNVPSKGPFDPAYMGALYQVGFEQGRSAAPFRTDPPPYPGEPASQPSHLEKTGENR